MKSSRQAVWTFAGCKENRRGYTCLRCMWTLVNCGSHLCKYLVDVIQIGACIEAVVQVVQHVDDVISWAFRCDVGERHNVTEQNCAAFESFWNTPRLRSTQCHWTELCSFSTYLKHTEIVTVAMSLNRTMQLQYATVLNTPRLWRRKVTVQNYATLVCYSSKHTEIMTSQSHCTELCSFSMLQF